MHRTEPAAWDIYARGLLPLGHGHPLWYPEPCLKSGEVRIGDVGYFRNGRFTFLFNTMHSADHPLNAVNGVPCGFEVFDPSNLMLQHLPDAITQSQLHSNSIRSVSISAAASARYAGDAITRVRFVDKGDSEPGVSAAAGLRYQCSEASGALLMLKQSAHKTYIDCRMHIQKYVRAHISNWLDFVNGELGIGLEEKDIKFVSGHTKTTVWAEAAFGQRSSGGELVVSGGCVVPSVSGEFRVSLSQCAAASVQSREGPSDRVAVWKAGSEPREKHDQSIFINYYHMKSRRLRSPVVMQAAAGPHVLPDDDPGRGPSRSASWHSSSYEEDELDALNIDFDPVGHLLDYILKYSDAQAACATEGDLSALFQDQLPDNLEGVLETIAPQVYVDDDGLGTIVLPGDPRCLTSRQDACSRITTGIPGHACGMNYSAEGAPPHIRVMSFSPTTYSCARAPALRAPTYSALSALLDTSGTHDAVPDIRPYISASTLSTTASHPPPSPSFSVRPSSTAPPNQSTWGSDTGTSVRALHLRDMDEIKDTAISFRYMMDLDSGTDQQRLQTAVEVEFPLIESAWTDVHAATDRDVYRGYPSLSAHTSLSPSRSISEFSPFTDSDTDWSAPSILRPSSGPASSAKHDDALRHPQPRDSKCTYGGVTRVSGMADRSLNLSSGLTLTSGNDIKSESDWSFPPGGSPRLNTSPSTSVSSLTGTGANPSINFVTNPPSHTPQAVATANPSGLVDWPPQRKRRKLPNSVTAFLQDWLHRHSDHPYPSEDEKRQLCCATGLSESQVNNWMIHARRRSLSPARHNFAGPSTSTPNATGSGGADMGTPERSPMSRLGAPSALDPARGDVDIADALSSHKSPSPEQADHQASLLRTGRRSVQVVELSHSPSGTLTSMLSSNSA